ncbi:hypothetical protein TNCV_1593111 [Trichonephila clavipes]|nr:hypothetical protein TNCV_1593111 [Trichonephila clavipes]
MHYMYSSVNGNSRAALQMYQVRFPDRRMLDHRIFSDVHTYLNATFEARWNGHGRPAPWPPRSPDLLNLDYF